MTTMSLSTPTARPRALSLWLFAIAAMVFAMVVIGGITRLTQSGLSMVRWEPVIGVVPPLNETQWQAEFDAYKAYPEYRKVNRGMTLSAFKSIYAWEYLHRLLGRLIGIAFAVPLAWFAWVRAISRGYGPRLAALLALGGLQGAIGWWMVASGLVDRPDVAHERLAIHLVTALLLFAALLWTALDLRDLARPPARSGPRPRGWVIPFLLLLFAQIGFGAFVAGLDAGYAFNSWPMMGEHWVPPGLATLAPLWRNVIDNPIAVQFIHRCLAVLVALSALLIAVRLHQAGAGPRATAFGAVVLLQFALGVATLLSGVNVILGIMHQAGAALLLGATIWAAHWATRTDGQ